MAIKNTGNFIVIRADESMQTSGFPIATFNISGINEEDTMEYYPIMSNFYDTGSLDGTGSTLMDVNYETVPSKALSYNSVNKINYNGTIYWLSIINADNLIYRTLENSTSHITISTTDDWNTYTVTVSDGNTE